VGPFSAELDNDGKGGAGCVRAARAEPAGSEERWWQCWQAGWLAANANKCPGLSSKGRGSFPTDGEAEETNMGTEVVPVFQVSDVDASVREYVSVLGFGEDFRWGTYAGLVLDGGARLHLNGFEGGVERLGKGAAYFFVPDVDTVYARVVREGGRIDHPLGDQAYGMRDFSVLDRDGNRLTFGTECSADEETQAINQGS